MNESDQYILDTVRHWVWSGYHSEDEIHEMIEDILEEDADEEMLRYSIATEFAKKTEAEATWPAQTDCDRLDRVFAGLNAAGIIALSNAGYTMSDGFEEVSEVLHQRARAGVKGYCFYHEQDVERAIDGGGLTVAFGDLDDDAAQKVEVGKFVVQSLVNAGFLIDWNGDGNTRLIISPFDWKRRFQPS